MYFVPEGRSKSFSIPEIFVVETELMPLWRWELWLVMTAANERSLKPADASGFDTVLFGNTAQERPQPFPQLRV